MNLHQFRVLSALIRLPAQFTTADIIRESGVSAQVVRKVYQRRKEAFVIVGNDGSQKLRSLTASSRDKLLGELIDSRTKLEPPASSAGLENEPLGLDAAEITLYSLVPQSKADERLVLLREARSHFELASQEWTFTVDSGGTNGNVIQKFGVENRLNAIRRTLHQAHILHNAELKLEIGGVPRGDAKGIGQFVERALNAAEAKMASPFDSADDADRLVHALRRAGGLQSQLVYSMVHAVRELGSDPTWHRALGTRSPLWSKDVEVRLQDFLVSTRFRGWDADDSSPGVGDCYKNYPEVANFGRAAVDDIPTRYQELREREKEAA